MRAVYLISPSSINYDKKQVELTLRSGEIKQDGSSLSLAELSPGQKIEGKIKKVEDYGLFISIEGSKLSGLCHKSEVMSHYDIYGDLMTDIAFSFQTAKMEM